MNKIRVLWVSPNGGNYKLNSIKGTGGWIGALQNELTKREDIELGIVFPHATDKAVLKESNTTYYPINTIPKRSRLSKLINLYTKNGEREIRNNIKSMVHSIEDFNPDIVHVWGLENYYSGVIPYIYGKYKTVVHIQGLTSLSLYIYIPPYVSVNTIGRANTIKDFLLLESQKKKYINFRKRALRELELAPLVKYWIGRTEWDKTAASMLSPDSKYYHCDEMMRKDFSGKKWGYHYDGKVLHIHSSISELWYKGIDIILKTANILHESGVDFIWNVYGVKNGSSYVNFFKKLYGLKKKELSVYFHGMVGGDTINNSLLESDVFVHPSYIENSSNAIAEAMLLGVPTIAQYVGGNPSMLHDNSGVLVAPNEPYILAAEIMKMRDKEWAEGYSERALEVSKKRQDSDRIVNRLCEIYSDIISGLSSQ